MSTQSCPMNIMHQDSEPVSVRVPVPYGTRLAQSCFVVLGMLFIMVALGGYTRLTGSGLSMVDWRPITGLLPPFTEQEWLEVFNLYKTSPEYHLKNIGMDLTGFKEIFWLEFIHRLWGRMIGLVFLLPIVLCVVKPVLRPWLRRFIAIWVLGGLQGLMGWYMVKSGLHQDPEVSPYRLCAHLLLAFLTAGCIFWTALTVRQGRGKHISFLSTLNTPLAIASFILMIMTIVYGAFVAGMKAGFVYNTFPLMGEGLVPDEILFYAPWYHNLVMNPVTVQFAHRVLALTTFAMIMVYAVRCLRHNPGARTAILVLKGIACLQVILGISTLITQVQIDLAVAHQVTALVLCLAFLFVQFKIGSEST